MRSSGVVYSRLVIDVVCISQIGMNVCSSLQVARLSQADRV